MSIEIFTPTEAGERLKVSPKTIVGLCAAGRIPGAVKVGRQWRIPDWGIERMFGDPPASGEGCEESESSPPARGASRFTTPRFRSRADILAALGGSPRKGTQ